MVSMLQRIRNCRFIIVIINVEIDFAVTKEVSGRLNDPFFATVSTIMRKIESRMRKSPYAVELTSDEPNRLQAPPDHGSDRYTQWINSLVAPVARIEKEDCRRFFYACRHHLEVSGNSTFRHFA